ncbi:MAG TPA: hypothetical protein VEU62_15875, partial [Bryobacterales bacterium]|nr:hypothetical protein [Bryobacterales bacterium]
MITTRQWPVRFIKPICNALPRPSASLSRCNQRDSSGSDRHRPRPFGTCFLPIKANPMCGPSGKFIRRPWSHRGAARRLPAFDTSSAPMLSCRFAQPASLLLMETAGAITALQRTPLYSVHRASGAKMVDFGGWDMPVEYSGIIDEHLAVRTRVGLFDVSHMGEIEIRGPHALELVE